MAVGANTYGSEVGVERLIGDIVVGRDFGATTTPTVTQVEAELDAVAGEMNNHLKVHGFVVPIDQTDDPEAYDYAAAVNNYGASARLLSTIPPMAFNPEGEKTTTRAEMYEAYLKRWLKMVEERKMAATTVGGIFSNFFVGASQDDDGNTKLPLMTRDMDTYPSTRTYVE